MCSANANEIRTQTLVDEAAQSERRIRRGVSLTKMTPRVAERSAEHQRFTQEQDDFAPEKFHYAEQQPIELGFSNLTYQVNDDKKSKFQSYIQAFSYAGD